MVKENKLKKRLFEEVKDFRIPTRDNKSHPMLRVPGTGQARWDPWIGRWVVGKLSYEESE